MTKHEAFNGILDTDPDADAHRVFFAFSTKQFDEGMERCRYKKKSAIVHAGAGIYGSEEAVNSFLGEYDKRWQRIAQECDPQKVYDYEFDNRECDYTCNDEEAIKAIVEVFGKERARKIKRRRVLVEV